MRKKRTNESKNDPAGWRLFQPANVLAYVGFIAALAIAQRLPAEEGGGESVPVSDSCFLKYVDNGFQVVGGLNFRTLSAKHSSDAIVLRYTFLENLSEGYARAGFPKGFALVRPDGTMINGKTYPQIGGFRDGFAPVYSSQDGSQRVGFLDRSGKLVVPYNLTVADSFSEGLAAFRYGSYYGERNKRFGYIDGKGNVLISPQFEKAKEFSQSLAVVRLDGKYGYIDKSGRFVIQPKYDSASSFSEGLALVEFDGKQMYVNKTGEVVITAKFDFAGSFSEGMAEFRVGGKYGYIDKSGAVAIPAIFQETSQFRNGYAAVRDPVTGLKGLIDKNGNWVIKPRFKSLGQFSEGLLSASTDGEKYGYVNVSGDWIVAPIFSEANRISEGYAAVKFADKYGFMKKPACIE